MLVLFSLLSVAQTVGQHPQLSQIDEASHIDAVLAAPGVVRTGQHLSSETLDIVSCRLVEDVPYQWPPCGSAQPVPAADYPIGAGGFTTADVQPPVYYWLTAAAAAAAGWVTNLDPVVVMRLTGAVWMALGACLTWLLARRLGAGRGAAFGGAALLVATSSAQQMSAIVNPAAMLLPVGAAYALLALWARGRGAAWWALPLGAVAAMAVTAASLAGLAVVWLFLLVDAVWPILRESVARRSARRDSAAEEQQSLAATEPPAVGGQGRMLGIVGASALAAAVTALGWWWIQAGRAVRPFRDLPAGPVQMPADLTWSQVLDPVLNFVAPVEFAPPGVRLGTSGPVILQTIALCVLVGLVARAWSRASKTFPALVASLVAVLVLPVAFVLLWYWAQGRYFTPWFRFGLAMMPFLAASVAADLRRPWSRVALAGVAAMALALTLA